MARTYLTDLNLSKNEIQNVSLQKLASAPSDPISGQIYFNTTDSHIYEYDGNTWRKVAYWDDITGAFKTVQTPVSDPTSSGNALDFIDSISQNANGEITVTKKKVNIGTASGTVAAGNHTHGNITTAGALQTNDVAIATGDKLVITDASNSNKVARSSTTFDISGTRFLREDGSWQTITVDKALGDLTDVSLNIPIGNRDVLRWVEDTWVNSPETSLSLGTPEGNGNAITDISVAGHEITITKGETFLTNHQSIKTLNTTATTAQTTSASEAIAGSGTITLHKVSKTGDYNDLLNKPTIPVDTNQTVKVGSSTFGVNAAINFEAASGSHLTLNPTTTSGSEKVSFAIESGYSIPSTTDQADWSNKVGWSDFDDTPTDGSINPVTSDGIYEFVNSSIENVAAYYITKNAAGDPFTTKAELNAATTYYSGGSVRVPTRNDYCIVLNDESQAIEIPGYTTFTAKTDYIGFYILVGSTYTKVTDSNVESLSITPGTTKAYELPTTRYINTSSTSTPIWSFQYIVNNSGLTAAQVAAINSGINASLVSKITDVNDGKFSVTVVTGQGTASDSASNIFSANQSGNTGVTLHIPASPSDIGAASSTHTHGNIQNGGTLQTNDITISSGDKLVVTDSSDSNKIARTSLTFGSATDQYLGNDGSWHTLPAGTVDTWRPVQLEGVQKLGSDITSGAINFSAGTNVSITEANGTFTFASNDHNQTVSMKNGSSSEVTFGADAKVQFKNGDNVTLTGNTTNNTITVASTDQKLAVSAVTDPGPSTDTYDLIVTNDNDATITDAKNRKYINEVRVSVTGDTSTEAVLSVGNGDLGYTGYINVEDGTNVSTLTPTGMWFNNGTNTLQLEHNTITNDRTLYLPDKSGTLATTDDIYPSAICYLKIQNPAITASLGIATWTISSTATFSPALPTGKKADFTTAIVSIREVSTGNEVYTDVTYSANSLTIKMNSSTNIAANTYVAVIHTGLVNI